MTNKELKFMLSVYSICTLLLLFAIAYRNDRICPVPDARKIEDRAIDLNYDQSAHPPYTENLPKGIDPLIKN